MSDRNSIKKGIPLFAYLPKTKSVEGEKSEEENKDSSVGVNPISSVAAVSTPNMKARFDTNQNPPLNVRNSQQIQQNNGGDVNTTNTERRASIPRNITFGGKNRQAIPNPLYLRASQTNSAAVAASTNYETRSKFSINTNPSQGASNLRHVRQNDERNMCQNLVKNIEKPTIQKFPRKSGEVQFTYCGIEVNSTNLPKWCKGADRSNMKWYAIVDMNLQNAYFSSVNSYIKPIRGLEEKDWRVYLWANVKQRKLMADYKKDFPIEFPVRPLLKGEDLPDSALEFCRQRGICWSCLRAFYQGRIENVYKHISRDDDLFYSIFNTLDIEYHYFCAELGHIENRIWSTAAWGTPEFMRELKAKTTERIIYLSGDDIVPSYGCGKECIEKTTQEEEEEPYYVTVEKEYIVKELRELIGELQRKIDFLCEKKVELEIFVIKILKGSCLINEENMVENEEKSAHSLAGIEIDNALIDRNMVSTEGREKQTNAERVSGNEYLTDKEIEDVSEYCELIIDLHLFYKSSCHFWILEEKNSLEARLNRLTDLSNSENDILHPVNKQLLKLKNMLFGGENFKLPKFEGRKMKLVKGLKAIFRKKNENIKSMDARFLAQTIYQINCINDKIENFCTQVKKGIEIFFDKLDEKIYKKTGVNDFSKVEEEYKNLKLEEIPSFSSLLKLSKVDVSNIEFSNVDFSNIDFSDTNSLTVYRPNMISSNKDLLNHPTNERFAILMQIL